MERRRPSLEPRRHPRTGEASGRGRIRELLAFGTDFPFAPEPVTQMSIDGLTQYDGFDAAARRAIERDNALSLLPRLHKRVVQGDA